ncbi:ABC transporter permease [Halalkalibacter oceani]|uniref:ABC transporter permease n=2 Tax=Halalkalibacter oceani TaxID=1653776 RepID=UPI00339AD154
MKFPKVKLKFKRRESEESFKPMHPFWVIVQKEVGDHIRSWRFVILLVILFLTCFASLYTALSAIRDAAAEIDSNQSFLFLNLFTLTDQNGSLPPFITFISFLGPILGIGLGFDAISAERNKGTLSRIVSQPIPRDYLINAKFVATLLIVTFFIFSLGFLVIGLGILSIGLPPTWDEFARMVTFLFLSVIYIGFWLNLAILFSVRFKQTATSALASIGLWLFFSLFYSMLVNLVSGQSSANDPAQFAFMQMLSRLNPSYLFSEMTTILLTPSIRALGPLTMEQAVGAIPTPLPFMQSLLLIWPQFVGLLAATCLCFGISYLIFMRQEIRA